MSTELDTLRAAGALDALDVCFARALGRLAGETEPAVLLGAAFANRAPTHGHVCADLRRLPLTLPREMAAGAIEDGAVDAIPGVSLPDPDAWRAALQRSALVRGPGEERRTPLVLDGDALYLDRMWTHQRRLVDAIRARLGRLHEDVDGEVLRDGLGRLFPGADPHDRQRIAALLAVLRDFTVIVGGPGTGKTATVVRVLALLQAHARAAGGRFPLRVALAAPTGKAAARLTESIRAQKAALDVPEAIRAAIPEEAATLHRLLGYQPRGTGFRHDAEDPLPADVVVVDEASMVDLALMSRLVDAVAPGARLVLLGDRDQLASVEAGAVLGDICAAGGRAFSGAVADAAARLAAPLPADLVDRDIAPGIADATIELTRTWRFPDGSGIGLLAAAINAGDADAALACLDGDVFLDASRLDVPPGDDALAAALRGRVVDAFRPVVAATTPAAALAALDRFRVVCAHRRGRRGVGWLNHAIERWLTDAGLIAPHGHPWYPGRPIMITRNDAALGLYNGDVGVLLDRDGDLRAWFPGATAEGPRAFAPGRLPPHDTVYAMTVHKSQGSEFDDVVVVLPDGPSPLLTRELLYTAVTRASRGVTLVGGADAIRAGIATRVERMSGLRAQLA